MKMLKILFISIFLILSSVTSAHAIGDREKGALLGAGAVILLGNILGMNNQQATRYEQAPVYYAPQPQVIYREPYVRERVIIYDHPPRYRSHPHRYYDGYRSYDSYRHYR